MLGVALIVAAALPTQLAFEIALVPVGAMAVFFGTTANAHMQMSSAPQLRGRVMAIYMLLTLGTTVVGGPFVGWVCQHFEPARRLRARRRRDPSPPLVLAVPLILAVRRRPTRRSPARR